MAVPRLLIEAQFIKSSSKTDFQTSVNNGLVANGAISIKQDLGNLRELESLFVDARFSTLTDAEKVLTNIKTKFDGINIKGRIQTHLCTHISGEETEKWKSCNSNSYKEFSI